MTDVLSIGTLRELLICDPVAGKLYWRERPIDMFASIAAAKTWNARFANNEALNVTQTKGYKQGRIFYKRYMAHRVIWAMHHGKWPDGEIDHENHIVTDNRIGNLRDATNTENQRNAKMRVDNTSGCTGVHWSEQRGKWVAQIRVDGKAKHIGIFPDLDDAIEARKAANIKHGYHQNHGEIL